MKVPLLAGFLALLVLLTADVVMTNLTLARRQSDQHTAFTREADRKASIDAGFDGHLAKPVEAGVLLQKVVESPGQK